MDLAEDSLDACSGSATLDLARQVYIQGRREDLKKIVVSLLQGSS